MSADATDHEQKEYPFLAALRWQGDRSRALTEQEEIALYERNWEFIDILAKPTLQELEHIRDLGAKYGSWLATECSMRIADASKRVAV
ncbi:MULTISPECIES: hypothetical protein [Thalassospira]|uniref:hypothetical protein n=1 Tax=Thalassospira TaxID=168934 RepID=UPI0007A400C4|nr:MULTISPECIES: hypothetical protein [Thalassospira]KZB70991.1 hypothetical protein AUQ43_09115 [Thalassospira sp. MCCC 1A01148]